VSTPSPNDSARATRDPWLDAVRGASVLAMVAGHTLDLSLTPALRDAPLIALYWSFRGLTAPLFLVVAGWALLASVPRLDGATVARRLQRAALILALGYGLHWPGISAAVSMEREGMLWPHLLEFDALPCIGWCLVLGLGLLAVLPRVPGRLGAFGTLAMWLPFVMPLSWPMAEHSRWLWHGLLGHAEVRFPLIPWAAFFFLGMGLATTLRLLPDVRHRAMALLGASGVLLLVLENTGLESWSVDSPWPAFYRMGQAMLVLGTLSAAAVGRVRVLGSLGRNSLGIYVTHLVLLYGWGGTEGLAPLVFRRLPLGLALGLAVGVLLASHSLARQVPRALQWLGTLTAPRWPAPGARPSA
jgi:acyltransferase